MSSSVLSQLREMSRDGTATFSGASAATAIVSSPRWAGVGATASSSPASPTSSMMPCTQSVQATARMPPTVS